MLMVRGVNLYPSEVERILLAVDGIAPHYQLIRRARGARPARGDGDHHPRRAVRRRLRRARPPRHPRRRRRPGPAHGGPVVLVGHGRAWPRGQRSWPRWRPPGPRCSLGFGKEASGQRPEEKSAGDPRRREPARRSRQLVGGELAGRGHHQAVWSTGAGASEAGRSQSAPRRSPRRAGSGGRTRLRGVLATIPRRHILGRSLVTKRHRERERLSAWP